MLASNSASVVAVGEDVAVGEGEGEGIVCPLPEALGVIFLQATHHINYAFDRPCGLALTVSQRRQRMKCSV